MREISALQLSIAEKATALVAAGIRRTVTFATAESCTGGMISAAITAVPGASAVFPGSVVSYANEIKARILGVSETTLASFGAVSAETASEMAAGVRRAIGSDFSVAVTGIAGPGGGTAEKPVGLVYLAVATPTHQFVEKALFVGSREEVRGQTVEKALEMLLAAVESGEIAK